MNDSGEYQSFLNERLLKRRIKLSGEQFNKLVNAYEHFTLNESILSRLGERVLFQPQEYQTVNDYVHHFLIKYSSGVDFYSDNYLELLNQIPITIQHYTERILGELNGRDRIYYINEFKPGSGRPYHIVVASIEKSGIVAWTHFESKKGYPAPLRAKEKVLIELRGLKDIYDNKILLEGGYEEYCSLKRKTLLYLGSNALSEFHRSQVSPLGL